MDAQSPHFGCFTLQQASTPRTVFLSNIGSDGQVRRSRKGHTKSRLGCKNCKVRKVKCDEGQPCLNCVKRNQECDFVAYPKLVSSITRSHSSAQGPAKASPAIPCPGVSSINMEHLRLLHHFDAFTSRTFIMDPEIWKKAITPLALQNTFLMHAVFLVATTHLQHLQPQERGHQVVALEQLSQVLPTFRSAIATLPYGRDNSGDALIACAMLLLQCSWTYDSQGWGSLLGLYQGLTSIVLAFMDRTEGSTLAPMLYYSPRVHIENYMKNMAMPPHIEATFAHCLACTRISDVQPKDPNDFIDVAQRIMTMICALDLDDKDLETSGIMLDVARCLFSLPNLLPGSFMRLIKLRDARAQVIMLYYFAAVSKLRAERFWWMRERAVQKFKDISCSLGERCEECTNMAYEIFCNENLD